MAYGCGIKGGGTGNFGKHDACIRVSTSISANMTAEKCYASWLSRTTDLIM